MSMGVYINMEMPKTCCACFCARDNECGITRYEPSFAEWYEDGVKDCPLVNVPPHGRLIDADALRYWSDDSAMIAFDYVTRSQINAAPTIIPASLEYEMTHYCCCPKNKEGET